MRLSKEGDPFGGRLSEHKGPFDWSQSQLSQFRPLGETTMGLTLSQANFSTKTETKTSHLQLGESLPE